MKKIKRYAAGLVFVSALYMPTNTHAFNLGILGGIDFASFTQDGISSDTNTGFMFGVFTNFGLPVPYLSVQPEFYFIQKGGEFPFGEFTYSYLEIPAFLKLKFPIPSIPFSIFAEIGLNIAFLVGATGGVQNFNVFDFGFLFGGGLAYKSQSFEISAGVRYGIGLLDFSRATTNDVHRNLELVFTVGIDI